MIGCFGIRTDLDYHKTSARLIGSLEVDGGLVIRDVEPLNCGIHNANRPSSKGQHGKLHDGKTLDDSSKSEVSCETKHQAPEERDRAPL